MGVVTTYCPYECSYRSASGFCGRTAGCVKETSITYSVSSTIPKKTIRITNDGELYSLYIGSKMVLKCSSLKIITDEINRYEEEHLL